MAGIEAISMILPSITSGTIFAPRRANKGAESNNALVAAMNFGIAGGQIGNVFRGVAGVAKASTGDIAAKIVELDNKIINASDKLSKADKIANGMLKAGSFTMRNINPAIGATELVKALFAKDKTDAALTGGCAFGSMLLGEYGVKNLFGLAKTSYKNGVYTVTPRTALYKKLDCYPVVKEQLKAIADYLVTKHIVSEKVIKHVPPIAKGVLFALGSIFSYAGGRKIGKALSNKYKEIKGETPLNNQENREAA